MTKDYRSIRVCIACKFRGYAQEAKNILDRSDPKDLIDLVRLNKKLIHYTSEHYRKILCHGKNGLSEDTIGTMCKLPVIVSEEINVRINYTNDYRQKLEGLRSDIIELTS